MGDRGESCQARRHTVLHRETVTRGARLNRPGVSGDSGPWKGWGPVRARSRGYPWGLRELVVRMVAEVRIEQDSEWTAMSKVAGLFGVDTLETVCKWCRQAQVDSGARPGVSRQDSAEVNRLKRENAKLKRANWRFQGVSATTWESFSDGVM